MNFTATIKNVGEKEGWVEKFNERTVNSLEDARAWLDKTLEWFNSTLQPGEPPREIVDVAMGGDQPLEHHWLKQNLVTIRDYRGMFDRVKCEACGAVARRYGLQTIKRQGKFRGKKWTFCPGK